MNYLFIGLAVFLCILMPCSASADELPLWEAGFGVTGLSLPDYRGSSQERGYILPLPYIVYRGDILRMDRKGMYGLLFQSERLELNVSLDAGVPVKSSRNSVRTGMPNLDPTLQIGPALEICLVENCHEEMSIQFRLPIRAVFASDFTYLQNVGFVINPQLNAYIRGLGADQGWNFGCAVGPLFATKRYHAFYYGVDSRYVSTEGRQSYDASAGYSGSLIIATISKRSEKTWLGIFVRYDNLSGASFADSPLVTSKHAYMAGLGIAWIFGQSPVMVHADL